jgi:hypothetical protein
VKRLKRTDQFHAEIGTGPLCLFRDHNAASRDGRVPRYSDTQACVQCIQELTTKRCSLDVHRIQPHWRRTFLEFWSLVEIRDFSECWPWHGNRRTNADSGYFSMTRHWTTGRSFSPSRVAFWVTWGDIGRLPIKLACRNPCCCNPLHLRAQGVQHYFLNQRLQIMSLDFSSKELARQTAAFVRGSSGGQKHRNDAYWRNNRTWLQRRLDCDPPSAREDVDLVNRLINDVSVDVIDEATGRRGSGSS